MTGLTERLLAVVHMVKRGGVVADIGADHALLPIYLVEKGIVSRAIVSELNEGPYQRALQAVNQSRLSQKIVVRQGNGLQTLTAGEADTIVIAGMGANTIIDILAYDWMKAESFNRYVFQPMSKIKFLRSNLSARGWPILDECLIEENGQFYVVITSTPGKKPYYLSELELEVGPFILRADTEKKREFLNAYRNKYRVIYSSLLYSCSDKNREEAHKYKLKIEQLEVILDGGQG